MIGNEERTGEGISLEEFVSKVERDPSNWVLVLGDEISFNKEEDCKKQLSQLAKEAVETEKGTYKEIYKALQEGDCTQLSGALFGNIWDGATFLDKDQERKMERRRSYVQRLGKRDTINLCGTAAGGLQYLLGKFRGIIVTTCQDETVEAAWEYGNSLPADNIVCTPYELTTSHAWSRWLDAEEETELQQNRPFSGTALVKLFGSVSNPNRMLLSPEDIQSYYPASTGKDGKALEEYAFSNEVNTVRLLEKIFQEKHLLFLGVNFTGTGLLASAGGILALLKKEKRGRYALHSKGLNEYAIQPVNTEHTLNKAIRILAERWPAYSSVQALKMKKGRLTWEEIQRLFFQYYIRRSPECFLQRSQEGPEDGAWQGRELDILRDEILVIQDEGKTSGPVWTRESIIQLAFAANNLADFYDLAYAFRQAREEMNVSGRGELCRIPLLLLRSRLTQRSLRLHKILSTYESEFPLSFLRLLPCDGAEISVIPEENLVQCTQEGQEAWIKSGIQLVNSGIYIKHNGRGNLYGRMIYADALMRFAGSHPYKDRFQKEIEQLRYQARDSYFYPLNPAHIQLDIEDFKAETVGRIFAAMFGNLYVILRDKIGGYQQIHAALQTETPKILSIMWKLEDPELRWKPGLLYLLLHEGRVVPEPKETLKKCDGLMKCLKQALDAEGKAADEWKRLFCMKLMVAHAEILIRSQSRERTEQRQAQNLCEKLCGEIEANHRAREIWKRELPESVFEMHVRTYFLMGKTYGRESTIVEIQRCKGDKSCRHDQKELLDRMCESLRKAERLLEQWERDNPGHRRWELRGELCRLQGEYHFKLSQYCMENRRYNSPISPEGTNGDLEERSYQAAKEKYEEALNIYQKDTGRYKIPLADTLRSLADVFCRWAENCESIPSEKEQVGLQLECYNALIRSYILYRGDSDLHGIADVLQSMGNAESRQEPDTRFRSMLNFYKASKDIYTELGDGWSEYVVDTFLTGAVSELDSGTG